MSRSRQLVCLFSLLVCTTVASAQKATLKWQLKKGDKFFQTMLTTTEQKMKVMGTDITQNQSQKFHFSWEVTAVDGDKVTLKQKIIGVEMNIDIGGSKIEYKSGDDASKTSPLKGFFDALMQADFEVVFDHSAKGNKITEIKNQQEFIKKLTDANPQMKGLLEQILSEGSLKEMAGPSFSAVPGKEVAKDETWDRTVDLDMGPIGRYKTTYNYKFTGQKDKLATITVTPTLEYTPPKPDVQKTLPFSIKDAKLELKKDTANGTVEFDTEKGRVISAKTKMDITGELTIEIGGQTTKVTLDQKQTTETTTSEKDPTKK